MSFCMQGFNYLTARFFLTAISSPELLLNPDLDPLLMWHLNFSLSEPFYSLPFPPGQLHPSRQLPASVHTCTRSQPCSNLPLLFLDPTPLLAFHPNLVETQNVTPSAPFSV